MRTITEKTFGTERLGVDGIKFVDCTFNGTTLVFGGGEMPLFGRGAYNGVALDFEGPAMETIKLLRQFMLMGGQELVFAQFTMADSAKH